MKKDFMVSFSHTINDNAFFSTENEARSCFETAYNQYKRGLRKNPPELYTCIDDSQGLYMRIDNR